MSTVLLEEILINAISKNLDGLGHIAVGASSPCLLYTSPSPRDVEEGRMPSSA